MADGRERTDLVVHTFNLPLDHLAPSVTTLRSQKSPSRSSGGGSSIGNLPPRGPDTDNLRPVGELSCCDSADLHVSLPTFFSLFRYFYD